MSVVTVKIAVDNLTGSSIDVEVCADGVRALDSAVTEAVSRTRAALRAGSGSSLPDAVEELVDCGVLRDGPPDYRFDQDRG